jgi:hypothetical protein
MDNHRFYVGAYHDNPHQLFWLDAAEGGSHFMITGATRTGKSGFLVDILGQRIVSGGGCGLLDAKGDTAEDLLCCLSAAPDEAWPGLAQDLVLIDPADPACTACFNPLDVPSYTSPARQVQNTVSIIKKAFSVDDTQAPRLGLVLRRTLQLAMEARCGLTLCDLPRILTDGDFRATLLERSGDETLCRFWESEFPDAASAQAAWTASTLVRLETLLDDPQIRRFLGQPRSNVNFRTLMDEGKVVVINLSKGQLGQESAYLLGGFLTVAIQLAAESRQQIFPAETRRPWHLCIDEAQNYVNTTAFQELLTEARGYGLSLTLANQHLAQLDEGFRHAILSNARVRVAFRVSTEDAAILAKEFWRYDGQRHKETRWDTVRLTRSVHLPVPEPVYFSTSEEQRQNREALHWLEDRLAWVHIQGDPAPTLIRTIEIPRADLAASRERLARFKEFIFGFMRPCAADQPDRAEHRPAVARGRTFEWAGRSRGQVRSVPKGNGR